MHQSLKSSSVESGALRPFQEQQQHNNIDNICTENILVINLWNSLDDEYALPS